MLSWTFRSHPLLLSAAHVALSIVGCAVWFMGYPDEAVFGGLLLAPALVCLWCWGASSEARQHHGRPLPKLMYSPFVGFFVLATSIWIAVALGISWGRFEHAALVTFFFLYLSCLIVGASVLRRRLSERGAVLFAWLLLFPVGIWFLHRSPAMHSRGP